MIDTIHKYNKTTKDTYKYTILLPTWNNLKYLKLCISSIKKNTSLSIQIIVFVNEGNDGTIEWLNEQSDIDYIHSEHNIGICYAMNMCRSLVKSDYIIYINDDMYILPNWDTELDKEISSLKTKLFMLSSTMIEPTNTGNPCVVVKNYGNSILNFNEDLLLKEYIDLIVEDWSGSTWPPTVVHIDLWDLVGGYSIEFSPGMYSDPDFSKKLYESGVRIFKGIGKSMVYHFGSKTTKKLKKSYGKNQFLLKWGITSNAFINKTLKRGESYNIIQAGANMKLDILLGKLKIFKLLFTSNKRK
jgi:glycosyltransferase involved in cell wall biosynthesis